MKNYCHDVLKKSFVTNLAFTFFMARNQIKNIKFKKKSLNMKTKSF